MNEIEKIVTKYGPEITKTLKIASNQVYDKAIWYVRVDGVIGLVNAFVFILVFGLIFYLTHGFIKKIDGYGYRDFEPVVALYIISFLISLLMSLLINGALVPSIMKIIAPEYWIISQIINSR